MSKRKRSPGLDGTDEEVAAVAGWCGRRPESEQEMQAMLGTFGAQMLIFRLRWKALRLEAGKPLRLFLDLVTRAKGGL